MAQKARAAGKPCAIGSNLETDLGQAPHVCLAASLSAFPVEQYACDLMGSLFYAQSATTPPVNFDHGRVSLPLGPGFGVMPRV
jgi:L-alanine-DL-glutamate epimerase-like enolase superfamily enzyme